MATIHEAPATPQWHAGEVAVHELLHIPFAGWENPTSQGLPQPYGYRVANSPLVAFGTLDNEGRPWTTIWGGKKAFTRPVARGVLGVQSLVDTANDPVAKALGLGADGAKEGEIVKSRGGGGTDGGDDKGKLMSALSIDLESRDRVKLGGRMIAGAVTSKAGAADAGATAQEASTSSTAKATAGVAEVQMAMFVEESLGNCPKYLNKKKITPHTPKPTLVSDTLPLPQEAIDLIAQADLFFLSSANAETQTMDTNHRGGPPGFVRVLSNTKSEAATEENKDGAEGVVLVYPEYSGNQLYQTLGNLQADPHIGLAIPNFTTGDILYLTGTTSLLVGAQAAAVLPHTRLAVRIAVHAALFVKDGMPFRGRVIDYSPYNPPVRRLASEQVPGLESESNTKDGAIAVAALVGREMLAPSVARLTFELRVPANKQTGGGSGSGSGSGSTQTAAVEALKPWLAGQHVTLDFSSELDHGWSHMRDDDPQSLNDDFVRTFTVSSVPPPQVPHTSGDGTAALVDGTKLQITVRRHGPVTRLLFMHNLRSPLEVPVLGFSGDEAFRIPIAAPAAAAVELARQTSRQAVFVAGGVGITPLLAQAGAVLAGAGATGDAAAENGPLLVLWSLRAEDLPFAADVLAAIPGLSQATTLFVSKAKPGNEKAIAKVEGMGARVVRRRIARDDVLFVGEDVEMDTEKGASGDGGSSGKSKGARKRKYYVCTSPEMTKVVLQWLEAQDVVSENFNY